jgi:hypothetical protein
MCSLFDLLFVLVVFDYCHVPSIEERKLSVCVLLCFAAGGPLFLKMEDPRYRLATSLRFRAFNYLKDQCENAGHVLSSNVNALLIYVTSYCDINRGTHIERRGQFAVLRQNM